MAYTNIKIEKKEGFATLKINRPQALNALNKDTLNDISKAIDELNKDKKIKAVILTGEGDKAFIAGADIKQMVNLTPVEAKEFSELGHGVLNKIESSRLIFIAAINGYALGGGCETLMACDIAIASKSAIIGQPEINLGISPGFGGTQRLPRLVGRMKAKELILTGQNLDADEACKIGLVNIVVDDEKLIKVSEKIASKVVSKSGIQTCFIKELINKGTDIDLNTALALEISYFSSSFSTYDQKEGMNAFIEKKKPIFKDK